VVFIYRSFKPMTTPDAYLHTQAVTAIAGAVNSEFKIILANLAPPCGSAEWVNAREMQEDLRSNDAFTVADEVPVSTIFLSLARASEKGFFQREGDSFQRSEAGEIAYGFGGQLLEIGWRTNVPIKTFVGEDGQALLADGSIRDGVESRMTLLHTLVNQPPNRWIRMARIIRALEPFGMQDRSTRFALTSLENAKVTERRITPDPSHDGRPTVEMRLRRNVAGTDYPMAINDYVGVVSRLALMDVDMLNEGQRKARDIISQATSSNTLTMLLKRAQVTTAQASKTLVRSNGHTKPDGLPAYS
jgi:hypothetical protein